CCSGAPPNAHSAFCKPSASATNLSPPSTTWACSKPERQPEMVEPVSERLTRDRDAEPAHVGEVGQAHPPRRVLLTEDHIALGTIERPPSGDAPLQGPAHARRKAGLAPRGCRVPPPASA